MASTNFVAKQAHTSIWARLCLLFLLSLVLVSHANAAKLYKWVDANGNISYQSSPPPENAKILSEKDIKATRGASPQLDGGKTSPVTVFVVENCAACDALIARLAKLDISVAQKNLSDREVQKEVVDATSQLIAPTILIDSSYITDVSNQNLEAELKKAGYRIKEAEAPTQAQPKPDEPLPADAFDEQGNPIREYQRSSI